MNVLLLNYLKNFLFPKTCYGCGEEGSYLCPKCLYSKTTITYHPRCFICGKETYSKLVHSDCSKTTFLDGIIHLTRYEALVQKIIHNGKYDSVGDTFVDLGIALAQLLVADYTSYLDNAILSYVPSHPKKKRLRGYNQTKILAESVASCIGVSVEILLERRVHQDSQTSRNRMERFEALRNTYHLKEGVSKIPTRVLLVDDVFTTGATLNYCAKTLKEAGVKEVFGICIARV